jgi:hypothetical protein
MINRDSIPDLVTINDLRPGVQIRLHQGDAVPVDFVVTGEPRQEPEYVAGDWPLRKQAVPRVRLQRLIDGAFEYPKLWYFGIIPLPDGTWHPTNYCTRL